MAIHTPPSLIHHGAKSKRPMTPQNITESLTGESNKTATDDAEPQPYVTVNIFPNGLLSPEQ